MIKIKRVCEFGHEEREMPIEQVERVLSEGKGRYLIVKDNKLIQTADLREGDEILLVPIVAGG
jgi:molybdopterin converting factor small subunit